MGRKSKKEGVPAGALQHKLDDGEKQDLGEQLAKLVHAREAKEEKRADFLAKVNKEIRDSEAEESKIATDLERGFRFEDGQEELPVEE